MWKTKFSQIQVLYIPPPLVAVLHVPSDHKLKHLTATAFEENANPALQVNTVPADGFRLSKYLDKMTEKPDWVMLKYHEHNRKLGHFPTFDIQLEVSGPAVLMFTSDHRIGWQAILEKNDDDNKDEL